jgi:hypothetical protein
LGFDSHGRECALAFKTSIRGTDSGDTIAREKTRITSQEPLCVLYRQRCDLASPSVTLARGLHDYCNPLSSPLTRQRGPRFLHEKSQRKRTPARITSCIPAPLKQQMTCNALGRNVAHSSNVFGE